MAKETAHSGIPRLAGVTRIPVQGILRMPQKPQTVSAPKIIRPTSFAGLRPAVLSVASLKKSFSGERISEAASLVGKKTATAVNKFLTKPEKSANIDSPLKCNKDEMHTVIDKCTKDDINRKCANQEQSKNARHTLTRSQTFVRDSNDDDDENTLLGVTRDVIPSIAMTSLNATSNNAFLTHTLIETSQTFGSTVTIDTNSKSVNDIFNDVNACERLSDISIPSCDADATIKPAPAEEDSNNFKEQIGFVSDFEDTIIAPDKPDMKLVVNSTMNSEQLLDITRTISPSRHLMNITRDLTDSPQNQQNNTNLLYMSHLFDNAILAPEKPLQVAQKTDDEEPARGEGNAFEIPGNMGHILNSYALQSKPRFSFGLDLTECTLDCSIELCDLSLSSNAPPQVTSPSLKKQNSFEMDESLGILTPDQMKEFLDSTTTTTNLDLPINLHSGSKILHQMRIDQTPSPEDLPLDPVGVKTDVADVIMTTQPPAPPSTVPYTELSQTDSDSKTDQMTKSSVSKVSTSFITSVTSITSLDTGYQGDGEMSRPASRGAGDHSPSNVPRKSQLGRQPSFNHNNQQNIPIRRQDPMTDSDFFTESDADEIFHRGDRRAQVIDGQLYGPMLQPSNVFISEQPQMEDSCMESSGIFTDVENRCDDDIAQNRREADVDMSPDGSTDTVKSNNNNSNEPNRSISPLSQGHSNILTDSQTSSTIQSSVSCERISVSSINGDFSLQSKKNAIIDHSPSKSSSIAGSTGALNAKLALTTNNDVNKATATQKQELATKQQSSVKKVSPARKQHPYGSKYDGKAITSVEKNSKTGNGAVRDYNVTKSSSVNTSAKKSTSSSALSETCDDDMFVKPVPKRNDNQENKNPSPGSLLARKLPPNKWDAVMSKIAESKSLKKNYSVVKSKVSTGVLRRSPPGVSKSPTGQSQDSNCASVNSASGLNSPQTKRVLQGAGKRGRSYSKDSQQSSQSDLSLSGGSPKLHSKQPLSSRSAKKRDVRTLSISPTDLGPPPKTQTNITSRTKQQPASSQKQISQGVQQTFTAPLASLKGSPSAKKVVPRRSQVQQSVSKAPLKDYNRLGGQPQQQHQQQQPQQNGNTKTGIKPTVKGVITTVPISSAALSSGLKGSPRNFLGNSHSPVLSNNGITPPPSILHKKHHYQHQQQIQEQKLSHGALDFHLSHANRGVEALGVLLQYLVYDLEAFSCPLIKKECTRAQTSLQETRLLLEETKAKCHELQDELQDKESFYVARESELQSLHRCELHKVESSLSELQVSAKERIVALEAELAIKAATSQKEQQQFILESEAKLAEREKEVIAGKKREEELLKRLQALSATENELREKILEAENTFAERLQAASQRERELTEKINILNKQLDVLRHDTESRERALEQKLNLSHDEISVLRSSRNSLDQTISPKNGAANKVQMLQDEVESLRCVLELKQSEISDLRKHNQELQRTADELPAAQMKISALESRIEDLQIQLKAKVEEEKVLVQRNKHLQESYSYEVKNRNRLTLHNEELRWRLKQNSEKFALALTELSKSYQDHSGYMSVPKGSFHNQDNPDLSHNSSLTSLNRSSNGSDRMIGCFEMDDVSPPTSPIIKGIVKKSDSVSWVLEMDDESPEVLASRMVRRAGSFRSSFNEKCTGAKRQYSLPISSNVNPLSQSASATSVIRQHSSDLDESQNIGESQPNSRMRSKSVTIKGSENPRKLIRQNSSESGPTSRKPELSSSWMEPICSSSPKIKRPSNKASPKGIATQSPPGASLSPRASSFCPESENGIYRKPQRNLITCDTSALASVERIRSIPSSHPSVQDLKNLKKCQEIQESAGEAMVSGMNSEDEGCSASSDETASSASSGSTSSLGAKQHLSIEDALLMEKISTSLGGTPMEVSWSDDPDQFASESVV